jgi:endonuclease YncB( thermonuclease family)
MRLPKLKLAAIAFGFVTIGVAISLAIPSKQSHASFSRETIYGGVIHGRVIHVSDGDSITVRSGEANIKVRLAQIDAPETSQPWGTRAKQELAGLVGGQDVTLTVIDHDRYGRSVAQITRDNLDVNRAMVARGAAWAYIAYLTDDSLRTLEAQARAQRLGLWSMPANERVAPWDYRRERRKARDFAAAR